MEIFSKKTLPQQFRIVWKSNGEIQGCDYSYKEQVFENGVLFGEKNFDTMPVDFGIEDSPTVMDLSEVVEGINNQLIVNVNQLKDVNKAIETDLKSANNKLSETSNLLSESENKLSNANAQIEQLKAELENSNKQLVEVNKSNQELIKNIPTVSETPLKNED